MEEGNGIGEIFIYETEAGQAAIDVTLQQETVWLTLNQLSELFGRDKSVVSRHLKNIFQSEELIRDAVVANFATTASDGKTYQVDYYNLDVIISVGYRVNSKRGTQFRIWATNVLRRHLVEGYTLNEKRLMEQAQKYNDLKQTVKLLQNVIQRKELTGDESAGLLQVISDYTYALDVLDDYDHQRLTITGTHRQELFRITYESAMAAIRTLKEKFGGSELFGREKDQSFQSSINTIYQSFGGEDLYPSTEEKAANLLYFVVKNHSFSDGNKRIAAFLFVWFMEKNQLLYDTEGRKRIADNALVALTLLIAESDPSEKETMIKVIVNLINQQN
ncbi:virulence protein RhuM/Fic/DOC family protein [Pontibacter flavimaris]|uniref:Cytochrome C biogenesis protein CycH n=1 Tax=Pontibacter flavimaris TaxID=1797110 RepID=A0A1Q5PI48_9BACT|nr:virulence protein RhuM/Fic/DOC family protein [Pontibacter flavimaris]OKL41876.1 cytochrome C biogenesis protein CycH [Pontibacter flavimaris]